MSAGSAETLQPGGVIWGRHGVTEMLCNLQVTLVFIRKEVWLTSASNFHSWDKINRYSSLTTTSLDFICSLTDRGQGKQLRFKERFAVSPPVLMDLQLFQGFGHLHI